MTIQQDGNIMQFDYAAKRKADKIKNLKRYYEQATGRKADRKIIDYWKALDEFKFSKVYYAWQDLYSADTFGVKG